MIEQLNVVAVRGLVVQTNDTDYVDSALFMSHRVAFTFSAREYRLLCTSNGKSCKLNGITHIPVTGAVVSMD